MMEDRYIQVSQINTRYWVSGSQGPAVLLIHGLGGFVEYWGETIRALSSEYRVYAIDLVGFGRSDKPNVSYSAKYLAEFVCKFMDAVGLETVTLIGNSTGGAVVLQFVLLFPHRVEKLILEDSAGLGHEASLLLRTLTLPIIGDLFVQPSKLGIRIFLHDVIDNPKLITDDYVNLCYKMFSLPGTQKPYLAMLRSMGNIFGAKSEFVTPIQKNLGQITNPTLIIWGKQDRQLPIKHAYIAKDRIPQAQLQIIDHCGHIPHYEQPEQFNKKVLDFLSA